jgi:hypothetical protein
VTEILVNKRQVSSVRGSQRTYNDVISDPTFDRFIRELCEADAEFAALWAAHRVWDKFHARTTFDHPVVGRLTLSIEVSVQRVSARSAR